jgi:hypothetical protein
MCGAARGSPSSYGTVLDVFNRAAAKQASATDGQVRDVVAALLPAIIQALGQANGTRSKLGFLQQLKHLQAEGADVTQSVSDVSRKPTAKQEDYPWR